MTSKGRILVIDDSAVARESAKLLLGDVGYVVVALESASGIGPAISEHKPDIILLDVTMPRLTGDRLLKLAALESYEFESTPIVFFSERSDAELRELVVRHRALGYVKKTSDARLFVRQVDALMTEALSRKRRVDSG